MTCIWLCLVRQAPTHLSCSRSHRCSEALPRILYWMRGDLLRIWNTWSEIALGTPGPSLCRSVRQVAPCNVVSQEASLMEHHSERFWLLWWSLCVCGKDSQVACNGYVYARARSTRKLTDRIEKTGEVTPLRKYLDRFPSSLLVQTDKTRYLDPIFF